MRRLELKVGAPGTHGNKAGPAHDYWIKELGQREQELVARAEQAYARSVAHAEGETSLIRRAPPSQKSAPGKEKGLFK